MKTRLIAVALIVSTFVLLATSMSTWLSLDWITENEQQLRTAVENRPIRLWFAGLVVYFLLSLIPGTSGKSVVCGWIFGFWQAFLMVDIALTAAGFVMYSLTRSVFRQAFEDRFQGMTDWLQKHTAQDGAVYLLSVRFAHAPFSLINIASGLGGVHPRTFAWTTLCGLAPGTATFVFVGSTLPTLKQLREAGMISFLSPPLILALAVTAVAPLVVRLLSRKLLT